MSIPDIFGFLNPPKRYTVGIPTEAMNQVYAKQEDQNLCWAASSQMILNYWGVDVDQWDLARDICGIEVDGYPADCPANNQEIKWSLTAPVRDWAGRKMHDIVAPTRNGRPNIWQLAQELQQQRPVLIAYAYPGVRVGHAAVVTAGSFAEYSDKICIERMMVRDPWPEGNQQWNDGLKAYSGNNLNKLVGAIHAHWFVKVHSYGNMAV